MKCDLCGCSYKFMVTLRGTQGSRNACGDCCRKIGFPKTLCPISNALEKIDKRRKAKEDPCIGQTCTRCGNQIRASELWSHRVAWRGEPGETACAQESFYIHEPKCPKEE